MKLVGTGLSGFEGVVVAFEDENNESRDGPGRSADFCDREVRDGVMAQLYDSPSEDENLARSKVGRRERSGNMYLRWRMNQHFLSGESQN